MSIVLWAVISACFALTMDEHCRSVVRHPSRAKALLRTTGTDSGWSLTVMWKMLSINVFVFVISNIIIIQQVQVLYKQKMFNPQPVLKKTCLKMTCQGMCNFVMSQRDPSQNSPEPTLEDLIFFFCCIFIASFRRQSANQKRSPKPPLLLLIG